MPPTNYSLINTRPRTYQNSRREVRSEKAKARVTKRQHNAKESKSGMAKQRLAVEDQRKAQIKPAAKKTAKK